MFYHLPSLHDGHLGTLERTENVLEGNLVRMLQFPTIGETNETVLKSRIVKILLELLDSSSTLGNERELVRRAVISHQHPGSSIVVVQNAMQSILHITPVDELYHLRTPNSKVENIE